MKGLSILGSTGSIGTQTLEVVAASPERLSVAALAAHTNDALLEAQIRKFRPHVAALSDEKAAASCGPAMTDLRKSFPVKKASLPVRRLERRTQFLEPWSVMQA